MRTAYAKALARSCSVLFVVAAPSLAYSYDGDVVELAPRPVRKSAAAPAESVEPPAAVACETTLDAEAVETPMVALSTPWSLWIGSSLTYQSLTGADNATNDYLVGYLDMVLEGQLWEGAVGVVEFEGRGGSGPSAQIQSFNNLYYGWNATAGSYQSPDGFDRLLVAEAFVSLEASSDGWVVDVGKISSTSYLDTVRVANDSIASFLTGSFVNSTAFSAPFRGGGVAVNYLGAENFDFHAIAMRPDNSSENATSGVFGGAQAAYHWGQESRPGSVYVYGWSNGGNDDRTGFGVNADQDIGQSVTAFGRFAWEDELDLGPAVDTALETSWAVGFELRGGFCGCDADTFAVAVGMNESYDSSLDTELVYETFYRHAFNEHCDASFHIQGMDHGAGDPNQDAVNAFGLRVNFSL